MLALEGCLLLGLCATFGVVGMLVRHLDAPAVGDAGGRGVADRAHAARAFRLPKAA